MNRAVLAAAVMLLHSFACSSDNGAVEGVGGSGPQAGTPSQPTPDLSQAAGGTVSSGGSSGSAAAGTSAASSGSAAGGTADSNALAGSGGTSGAPAGSSGSGGAGGTGGAAAAGCSAKPYKFCEGFEGPAKDGLPDGWSPFKGYEALSPGDVALASDEAHGGNSSLKSSSAKRGATRAQKSLAGLGETAYHHWGRIFYKVDDPSPKPSGYFHTTFVALVGPGGENRIVDSVESPDAKHQWLFNVPSDNCCTSSGYNWKFDADWHCAEWFVDATAHSYRFFHDQMEVPIGFTNRGGAPMSQYTTLVVGVTYYQGSGIISSPFTVWFDDLAIDDERVGCD
ncbi:MAG TPA: hypothetical protein VHB79_02290 [Polyangiaceae bacterium]|nr:hypothetical protein [Polyangiaceae bacterium]